MATIPTAVLVPHKLNLTSQGEALTAAQACCLQDQIHTRMNTLDSLPGFQIQLKRDQFLSHLLTDATARVVVLSPLSHAIKSVLDARRELTDAFPLLERALWMIYVDKFEESFMEAAEHLGDLSRSSLTESPVWTLKKSRQSFVILAKGTLPSWYMVRAETHWRNKERASGGFTPLALLPRRPISVHQMPATSAPIIAPASKPPSSPPRALTSSSPPPYKKV